MIGKLNAQTVVIDKIFDFFTSIGFNVVFGSEFVTYDDNFRNLNVPDNSSITMDDATLYLDSTYLMRSHLSSIWLAQLKMFDGQPMAFLEVGKAYRHEENTLNTHSIFYQAEGVVIAKNIGLSHLKGIMENFVAYMFNDKFTLSFAPWWHPFTNFGASINIECKCKGVDKSCDVCKGIGVLDIATAGLVHESILNRLNIHSEYSAICFGLGPTRIAQIREDEPLNELWSPCYDRRKKYLTY